MFLYKPPTRWAAAPDTAVVFLGLQRGSGEGARE
jgi:hypothetical protein